jgi:hypothetical protein
VQVYTAINSADALVKAEGHARRRLDLVDAAIVETKNLNKQNPVLTHLSTPPIFQTRFQPIPGSCGLQVRTE